MARFEMEREMKRYVFEEYEGGRRLIMKIVKKHMEEQFEV